jgi:hypothetical protein
MIRYGLLDRGHYDVSTYDTWPSTYLLTCFTYQLNKYDLGSLYSAIHRGKFNDLCYDLQRLIQKAADLRADQSSLRHSGFRPWLRLDGATPPESMPASRSKSQPSTRPSTPATSSHTPAPTRTSTPTPQPSLSLATPKVMRFCPKCEHEEIKCIRTVQVTMNNKAKSLVGSIITCAPDGDRVPLRV